MQVCIVRNKDGDGPWTPCPQPGVGIDPDGEDDGLTQRLTYCTTCGKRPVVYWGLCGVAALAVAYVLCRVCRERDPHLHQVEAFLEARHRIDPGGRQRGADGES